MEHGTIALFWSFSSLNCSIFKILSYANFLIFWLSFDDICNLGPDWTPLVPVPDHNYYRLFNLHSFHFSCHCLCKMFARFCVIISDNNFFNVLWSSRDFISRVWSFMPDVAANIVQIFTFSNCFVEERCFIFSCKFLAGRLLFYVQIIKWFFQ